MKARWFLPETPDVARLLGEQLAVTITGIDAFARWAAGDVAAAAIVRRTEHEADAAKRALQRAVRTALITPLEPEDLFTLSQCVDWTLNHAKDAIGESEVMGSPPDDAFATMATHLAAAVRHIAEAVAAIEKDPDAATAAAEAAIKEERRLERAYRAAMAALLDVDSLRDVIARRELYRRCSRMGETAVEAAERVIYAVLKES
jgi:hypothetical protein